ncbi:MAG: tautomerase family protein [Sedimenticola sp.]
MTAKLGRSTQMKQALFRSIADEIQQRTKHNSDDLVIFLIENKRGGPQ